MFETQRDKRKHSHLRLAVVNPASKQDLSITSAPEGSDLTTLEEVRKLKLLAVAAYIDSYREYTASLVPADRLAEFKQFLQVSLEFAAHFTREIPCAHRQDAVLWFCWAVAYLTEPGVSSSRKKLLRRVTEAIDRCDQEAELCDYRCEPLVALLRWLEFMRGTLESMKVAPKRSGRRTRST